MFAAPAFDCEVFFGHDFAGLFDFYFRDKPRISGNGNCTWRTQQGQEIGYKVTLPNGILDIRVEVSDISRSN